MKKRNNKKLSVAIGICTCYGGESLLATAESILNSREVNISQFIISADRTPIKPSILKKLTIMGIKVIWNTEEGSQFKKLKQIIAECKSDILVFTQDDVLFNESTLYEIVNTFIKDPMITMVGTRFLPLPSRTLFEKVMGVQMRTHNRLVDNWNHGKNYLSASGRCLAFKTEHLKSFRIPETIVNGDTFLLLENMRLKGKFRLNPKAKVFIRPPQKFNDQIGPSSRYQFSQFELSKYFSQDLESIYKIPLWVLIKSTFTEFIASPVLSSIYLGVYLATRLIKQPVSKVSNPVWEVDVSTKKVN